MTRSHKIQLKPNKAQVAYFRQACGVSRFCYNWGLEQWAKQYLAGRKPSGMSLKKEFNSIYKSQFPWIAEVHRDAHAQPFVNLQKAMQNFFNKRSKHPHFKKRGRCKDSFYVANDKMCVEGKSVILPVIGSVKMTEILRFEGKIQAASVSRTANRWFISIQVECEPKLKSKTGSKKLGIDLGVKTSVTCSDGSTYQSPKPLKQKLRKLKHLQRNVSRKVKGSNNRTKAMQKLSKLHWRVENVRNDFLHKTTTSIIRESQACALENLSIKGMLSNHKLARAVAEQGLRNFRTLMEYKAKAYGVEVKVVDRFYPSSKTCSECGFVKPVLKLSERTFKCEACGFELDRDVNAAMNLMKQLGTASPEVKPVDCLQSQMPCGIGDRTKQEFNSAHLCVERK